MRVLFWSDTFYPSIGGVEVLATALLRALSERGHELAVVAGPYLPQRGDSELWHGIPVFRFPFEFLTVTPTLARLVAVKRRLAEVKDELKPDLVHVFHTQSGFFFHLETLTAYPTPTLLTLHGNPFDAPETVIPARRRLLGGVQRITAVSRAVRDEVVLQMPEISLKISVVPNALPMAPGEPSPPPARPRLLCLGRLHPDKGFHRAIEAFAIVAKHDPTVRLVMAGDGPERGPLQSLASRLEVTDRVDFIGWVAPTRAAMLLDQVTLVIVPSNSEAFGLVALEAAHRARPVVASRVDGLTEVVEDGVTGILTEPGDAADLARGILALLRDPERAAAIGAAARVRALDSFPWAGLVLAYEALYASLTRSERS